MVETITPVGHGGRRTGWAISLALHVLGAGAAAAAFGAALGGLGEASGAPWGPAGLAVVAAVAAAYAARELTGLPVPLLERRRQVPEWWRTFFSPPAASLLYGLALGIGFLTFLRHGTLVAVAAAALASGDPLTGALLVLPFGLARALGVGLAGRARSAEDVAAVVDRLEAFAVSRGPRLVNGLVLVAVAGIAAEAAAAAPAGDLGRLAPAALALAFGWAAGSKVVRPGGWARAVRGHRLGPLARPALPAVPAAEAAVAWLALAGPVRAAGGVALALLAAFSVATLRSRGDDGRTPCGCFGGRRALDSRVILARNAALALPAAAAAWGGGSPTIHAPAAPSAGELAPALLAALGLATGVWVVARSLTWLRASRG